MTTPRPDRSRTLSWAGIALAAALLLISGTRDWWRLGAGGTEVTLSGSSATGGLSQALAVLPLLALLLALTLRAPGRRVLAGLLVLIGLGGAVLGVTPPRPEDAQVRAALAAVTLDPPDRVEPTGWPVGFAVGALLLVLAATVMLLRAGRWPSRASRYETPAADPRPTTPRATGGASTSGDAADLWRALDRGEDPTGEPDPGVISRPPPKGDRMGRGRESGTPTVPPQDRSGEETP